MVFQAQLKLYLNCVAACFAVCGVSKVAIVTILCGGKSQTKCILSQMPLLCQNASHYTTFSHTRPAHSGAAASSRATERSRERRFRAFKRVTTQRSQKIASCYVGLICIHPVRSEDRTL